MRPSSQHPGGLRERTDPDGSVGKPTHRVGRFWHGYARAVTAVRWLIVPLWILITGAVVYALPILATGNSGFGSLIPDNSSAVQAQKRSAAEFGIPLLVDTIVVVHNQNGLPDQTVRAITDRAAQVDQQAQSLDRSNLPTDRPLAEVPIPNTGGIGKDNSGTTTVLVYLYFSPKLTMLGQTQLAQQYAAALPLTQGTTAQVTGTVPASVAQANAATNHLYLVEIGTVVFVFIIVALTFRSLVAPLITLVAAVMAYLITLHLLGYIAQYATLSLPPPLEPLIVALILGIITDYSVFYFTETRLELKRDVPRRQATRTSLVNNSPIIAVAGTTVAIGTAALYAARAEVYRDFGPGLAISVIVALIIALTFVPAMMAILGRGLYWPSRPGSDSPTASSEAAAVERPARRPSWLIRAITTRPGAAIATLLVVAGLGAAAYPLTSTELGFSFIRGLPSDDPARQGAEVASAAFPPGVLAPTEILVEGSDLASRTSELDRLQKELRQFPGVATVIGPTDNPLPGGQGLLVAQNGQAARFIVLLNEDPLGGPAITDVNRISKSGPQLLQAAGLNQAHLSIAGETAIASAASAESTRNLQLVLAVAFAAEFIILAIYLRALVAPVLLLFASGLVVAASLGLTTVVFQRIFHTQGLTFYAPFATAVLLVALGSDYNVFGIGRIWEYAGTCRLRDAMRQALPESTRAIATAGVVLAGSFAMVALIPLQAFYEMAFTMVVGLILDTFIVRSILTPALLTLAGSASGWPGRRLAERRREPGGVEPVPGRLETV